MLLALSSCIDVEPWGPLSDGTADVTVLVFDEAGGLEDASPFYAYDPIDGLTLRGDAEGRWLVAGYGPIDGRRLTGQRPMLADSTDPVLPEPVEVRIAPGFDLGPLPSLTVGTPLCLGRDPRLAVNVSCPRSFVWEVPTDEGPCRWTTQPWRVGFEARLPRLLGVVDADGQVRATQIAEEGPCTGERPARCPYEEGECFVGQDSPGPEERIDVLQGRFAPRTELGALCRVARPLDHETGPLRDVEWSATPWAVLLRGGPFGNCSNRPCPPAGVLRAIHPTGEVVRDVEGRFERLFEIPGRSDLIGVIERTGNTEGCDDAGVVWLLPDEGRVWQIQARDRTTLDVVASLRLLPSSSDVRIERVLFAERHPEGVVLYLTERRSDGNEGSNRLTFAQFDGDWTLRDLLVGTSSGAQFGLERWGDRIAIHGERNWFICPDAWFLNPEAHECLGPDQVQVLPSTLEGLVLSQTRRIVANDESFVVEEGGAFVRNIALVADGARTGVRDLQRLSEQTVAAAIISQRDMTFASSLAFFDLDDLQFRPVRIPLGPGGVTQMEHIDGKLHLMDAMQGVIYRVAIAPEP